MSTLLLLQLIFQPLVQNNADLFPSDVLFHLPDPALHMGPFLKPSFVLSSCAKVVGFSNHVPKRNLRSITPKPFSLEPLQNAGIVWIALG